MISRILLQCFVNSIYGSLLIILIIAIRTFARRKIPKRYICILWLLVMIRLIIPVSFESGYGILPATSEIFNLSGRDQGTLINHRHDRDVPEAGIPSMEAGLIDEDGILAADDAAPVDDEGKNDEISLPRYPYLDVLSVIWLTGSAIMLAYMVVSVILTGRRIRFAVPDTCQIPVNPTDTVLKDVRVYLAEDIMVPFLCGLITPKIVIPYDLPGEDKNHVVRHELAHIKRHDHILKPLFFVILAMYWYNPFVWVAFRLFSIDMEMACDEAVVDRYDENDRNEYVLALLSAAGKYHDIQLLSLPFGKTPIKERINGILEYKRSGADAKIAIGITVILMTMIFSSVHVSAGWDEIMITDYDLVIPVTDEASSKRYLLIPYHKDLNAYEMVELDDNLEKEVRENTDEFWYERPLSDYEITKNQATELEYILKHGDAVWEGHVLLRDEADGKRYDALARDYADRYTGIIQDADIGYIYADYEVKGLGARCEDGFWFLQTGTLMYIDLKDTAAAWRLSLTDDEYAGLEKWLSENHEIGFDGSDFEAWKPVFDELGIEYNIAIDKESEQYKGAVEWLSKMQDGFPPEGMSEEQVDEQIRFTIKRFDEDGDEVPFGTVPGMLITEENDKDRRTIIPIPDDIRQMMFDLNKEEFLKWNGMYPETKRSDVYRLYQEQAPKDDRLKGTWTLTQYERIYNQCFVDAVKMIDPDWQAGDDFDKAVISKITREEIETHISSDGTELRYDPE